MDEPPITAPQDNAGGNGTSPFDGPGTGGPQGGGANPFATGPGTDGTTPPATTTPGEATTSDAGGSVLPATGATTDPANPNPILSDSDGPTRTLPDGTPLTPAGYAVAGGAGMVEVQLQR